MVHSILVNTPISSPLHPQLNLPLLKGCLAGQGYQSKVIDSNILFFHYLLGKSDVHLSLQELLENPIRILGYYNDLEKLLWEKCQTYEGLSVGLRSLSMKHDRVYFESVIRAVEDVTSNPFITFYEKIIAEQIESSGAKIVGIAVTFQDQIIPAFTLASVLRRKMPDVKIVFGGQMITRCHDTMIMHKKLCTFYDYLVLWDGEEGFLDIHKEVIDGELINFTNVIKVANRDHKIDRLAKAPSARDIPEPDYSDLDFNLYFYPDMLIPLQTTRGCYAKCAFCAIPYGSNSYRVRPVDRVIDNIVQIQEHTLAKYGKKATYFKFMEDTSSPALLHELSEEIIARKLDVKWETFARLEKAFTKPGFLQRLYEGGCRKIHWGLETNDPSILKTMNKKTEMSYSDDVLRLSGEAGILNFCFILIGFPGESDKMRQHMVNYIAKNEHIHTITLATFDLTRGSPMERDFSKDNIYKLDMVPAQDFQVRLPYLVNGENWKAKVVPMAHQMMIDIIKARPDIGFMTLFPDQIRALFCEEFGNDWGRVFVKRYGEENVQSMLLDAQEYADNYRNNIEISTDKLPEPIRREHFRTKEDLEMIARAMQSRKNYEQRRFDQV